MSAKKISIHVPEDLAATLNELEAFTGIRRPSLLKAAIRIGLSSVLNDSHTGNSGDLSSLSRTPNPVLCR